MSYRLSKIYTRKGDDGTTSLDARNRILKDSVQVEAIGAIDELNSAMGVMVAFIPGTSQTRAAFVQIQHELFDLGGELCPPHRKAITTEKTKQLENWLDEWNVSLSPLKEFILPGGSPSSALCHLTRAICRRAERSLVKLHQHEPVDAEILRYINRLSDLLFVAARILLRESHDPEVLWESHEIQ